MAVFAGPDSLFFENNVRGTDVVMLETKEEKGDQTQDDLSGIFVTEGPGTEVDEVGTDGKL